MTDPQNNTNIEGDVRQTERNEGFFVEISERDFSDEAARAAAIERLVFDMREKSGERELYRPKISVGRAALNIILPLAVWAALFCTLYFTIDWHKLAISLGVSFGCLALYVLIRSRDILIWSIRVYQRFAPAEVRLRCVFTPTCSQYAIAALQKYGVIRGLPKIISRLKRCHPPNGGEDFL